MQDLSGIAIFVAVIDAGSFTGAAEALGMSKSAVSKQVSRLESRLGAQLLNRTTRRLNLTEVGRAFHERCKRIVEQAEEAELAVTNLQDSPRGRLRVTAPLSFGIAYLAAALPDFTAAYPDVTVDIDFSDRRVDILEEGFDLAIRIGVLEDSSLIARRIASCRRSLLASPDYWQKHGKPTHPSDLVNHECFSYTLLTLPNIWQFTDPMSRELISVKVTGRLSSNNGNVLGLAAASGQGCVQQPTFICRDLMEKGTLEPALEVFEPEPVGMYAIYPPGRHLSAKVRVFIDFLAKRYAGPESAWR